MPATGLIGLAAVPAAAAQAAAGAPAAVPPNQAPRSAVALAFDPAGGYPLDPADVARLPLGHPTINLDGRYRTTSRPPTTGLRPLRTD